MSKQRVNFSPNAQKCALSTALTAGNPLEPIVLQHGDEICASVNAKKILDWAISNQAPNRGRLNDHPAREYTEVLTVEMG